MTTTTKTTTTEFSQQLTDIVAAEANLEATLAAIEKGVYSNIDEAEYDEADILANAIAPLPHTPHGVSTMTTTTKEYVLTDGFDIADSKFMTESEYALEQNNSEEATDGNWWWVEASSLEHDEANINTTHADIVQQLLNLGGLPPATDCSFLWDERLNCNGYREFYSFSKKQMAGYEAAGQILKHL